MYKKKPKQKKILNKQKPKKQYTDQRKGISRMMHRRTG